MIKKKLKPEIATELETFGDDKKKKSAYMGQLKKDNPKLDINIEVEEKKLAYVCDSSIGVLMTGPTLDGVSYRREYDFLSEENLVSELRESLEGGEEAFAHKRSQLLHNRPEYDSFLSEHKEEFVHLLRNPDFETKWFGHNASLLE